MPDTTIETPPVANPLDAMLSHAEEVDDELVRRWLITIRDAESETAN